MPSARKLALAKVLPVENPHPGEKLVIYDFARDGSGRFSWHFAPLNKDQLACLADNPVTDDRNPPAGACIEIHIKNFDVSQLAAVMAKLPDHRNEGPMLYWTVVDLDEHYAASMEPALELVRTVGIPESKAYLSDFGPVVSTNAIPLDLDEEAQSLRTAILAMAECEWDERKVDGKRVDQFWDTIGHVLAPKCTPEEWKRFVRIQWAIDCRIKRKTRGLAYWAIGAAAVAAVAGVLSSI